MNPIMKIAGTALLGGLVAGCQQQPLSDAGKDLSRYDTDKNQGLNINEADVLLTDRFDVKPKDGKFSDEEVLDVVNFVRKIEGVPIGNYDYTKLGASMDNIFRALTHRLNEQEAEKKISSRPSRS